METETATILIGNSDNKLTQKQWSKFIEETRDVVKELCAEIHFDGGSKHDAPYQNACFVVIINLEYKSKLWDSLIDLRRKYDQYSIAIIFGKSLFV